MMTRENSFNSSPARSLRFASLAGILLLPAACGRGPAAPGAREVVAKASALVAAQGVEEYDVGADGSNTATTIELRDADCQPVGALTYDKTQRIATRIELDGKVVTVERDGDALTFSVDGTLLGTIDPGTSATSEDQMDARFASIYPQLELATLVLQDESLLRALHHVKGDEQLVNIAQPEMSSSHAYWCAVGTAGATIVGGPIGGFAYACICGGVASI